MADDFYSMLGVDKNASQDDIKKQYRKLSKQYHPDLQQGKSEAEKKEAEEKFKKISEAYDTLSDPDKKRHYDMFGSTEHFGNGSSPGGSPFDMGDFFRRHAEMFGGMFNFGGFGFGTDNDMFGGNSATSNNFDHSVDGKDVKIKLGISLEEAITGVIKEFDVKIKDNCPECNGTGAKNGDMTVCPECMGSGQKVVTRNMMGVHVQSISPCPKCGGCGKIMSEPCPHCHGSSKVDVIRHVKLDIKPGTESQIFKYGNKLGISGIKGGKSGNLYVDLTVMNSNSIFKRIDKNILEVECIIDPLTAMVGGTAKVPTPTGIQKIQVPKETRNLSTERFNDLDPFWKLNVIFKIEVPSLSPNQYNEIKKLKEKYDFALNGRARQEDEFRKMFK